MVLVSAYVELKTNLLYYASNKKIELCNQATVNDSRFKNIL